MSDNLWLEYLTWWETLTPEQKNNPTEEEVNKYKCYLIHYFEDTKKPIKQNTGKFYYDDLTFNKRRDGYYKFVNSVWIKMSDYELIHRGIKSKK